MQWDLWNYAPLAHYDRAIAETREGMDAEVRTDGVCGDLYGGTTRSTVYYWLEPNTGAALEHTRVNDGETVPYRRVASHRRYSLGLSASSELTDQ